ncbi:hypothetical protein [Leucobacter soli]|uniref:hypothetical protein n=1 Tax=Leucobacter soli TaxID=2812850 RepID=UPI00360C9D94
MRGSGEPGRLIPDLSAATVSAVGHLTRLDADSSVLDILRIVDPAAVERDDQLTLRATWPGQTMPAILATLE